MQATTYLWFISCFFISSSDVLHLSTAVCLLQNKKILLIAWSCNNSDLYQDWTLDNYNTHTHTHTSLEWTSDNYNIDTPH